MLRLHGPPAFPHDELDPISCAGRGPDLTNLLVNTTCRKYWFIHRIFSDNWAANDVAGNYSVTLVDVLDTFVVMGDVQGFDTAVKNVIEVVSFNVNTRPQVFEATIRVLGGLLSAHIFASRPNQPFYLPWYKGELLRMAHDLGNRLLPAFSTPTGIPYARVKSFGINVLTCIYPPPDPLETRRTPRRRLRNLYVIPRSAGYFTPTHNAGTAGAGNQSST